MSICNATYVFLHVRIPEQGPETPQFAGRKEAGHRSIGSGKTPQYRSEAGRRQAGHRREAGHLRKRCAPKQDRRERCAPKQHRREAGRGDGDTSVCGDEAAKTPQFPQRGGRGRGGRGKDGHAGNRFGGKRFGGRKKPAGSVGV